MPDVRVGQGAPISGQADFGDDLSVCAWREVRPKYGMDLTRDCPPRQLASTGGPRRWFKIEGGKLFLRAANERN